MSHVEKQIAAVRNKLLANLLIDALAWGAVAMSGVLLLGVMIDRLFAVSLPVGWRWAVIGGALGVWLIGAVIAAYWRRPTEQEAAVAIDDKLGLKERFATALFAAPSSDEFAMAAVRDAQETARHVDLGRQFPLHVGRQWRAVAALLALAVGGALFLPRFDFFSHRDQIARKTNDDSAQQSARVQISHAIALVSGSPRFKNDELDLLSDELQVLARLPKLKDPDLAGRLAQRAIDLSEEVSGTKVNPPKAGERSPRVGAVEKGNPIEGSEVKWGEETPGNNRPDTLRPPSNRRPVAGERLDGATSGNAPSKSGDPSTRPDQQAAPGGKNPAGGNDPRISNPAGNAPGKDPGNAPGKEGNAPGQPNAPGNNPGIEGRGDRNIAPAPYAVTEAHSPSQDNPKGKIIARDLVKAGADVGKQRMTMAEAAKAARERAADEVDADHVSGPAQSAARKYFKTTE